MVREVTDTALGQGDRILEQAMHQHGGLVQAVLRDRLQNDLLIEEGFQRVFIAYWGQMPEIQHPVSWLYVCAQRTAMLLQREAHRRQRHEVLAGEMQMRGHGPNPDAARAVEDRDQAEVLHACLKKLPAPQREVVLAHVVECESLSAIGRRLSCSHTMVSKRLAAGLATLRRHLRGRGITIGALALLLHVRAQAAEPPASALLERVLAASQHLAPAPAESLSAASSGSSTWSWWLLSGAAISIVGLACMFFLARPDRARDPDLTAAPSPPPALMEMDSHSPSASVDEVLVAEIPTEEAVPTVELPSVAGVEPEVPQERGDTQVHIRELRIERRESPDGPGRPVAAEDQAQVLQAVDKELLHQALKAAIEKAGQEALQRRAAESPSTDF